ncbi:MAG: substrate-binding domain-containing protein [Arenicella sp.]
MNKQMLSIFFISLMSLYAGNTHAQSSTKACLIVKVTNHAFFDAMISGAKKAAKANNIELETYWGESEVDIDSPIKAVKSCVEKGAKGILITPTDSSALAPHIRAAKRAGVLVIALDTPFDPYAIADATFATNNFKAGRLIGEYVAAKLGKVGKQNANIALLDLTPANVPVDYLRDNGFLYGFGIEIADPKINGDEKDRRIVGNEYSYANIDGGAAAMEKLLKKGRDINVVYGINDYAAIGAYKKLKELGKEEGVIIVSVDGDCDGIQGVRDNVIAATVMQFPFLMSSKGIEAIRLWADKGLKPDSITAGLHFLDTGGHLVTDNPIQGVESINTAEAMRLWKEVGNDCAAK